MTRYAVTLFARYDPHGRGPPACEDLAAQPCAAARRDHFGTRSIVPSFGRKSQEGKDMSTPTTTVDERYSAPGATPVSWHDTCSLLASAELFWLSTVRPNGQPHVTPLVGVWVDEALHFTTGDKEQKAMNLRANSRVALTTG